MSAVLGEKKVKIYYTLLGQPHPHTTKYIISLAIMNQYLQICQDLGFSRGNPKAISLFPY